MLCSPLFIKINNISNTLNLYINHLIYFRYDVYFRKPGKMENSDFYLEIYPLIAWIGTFIVILLVPSLVWIIYRFDSRFRTKRKFTALFECAFDIMTAIANQGINLIIDIIR